MDKLRIICTNTTSTPHIDINAASERGISIISLKNERETTYATYISVQNELVAAYNELRDREFIKKFPNDRMSFVEANKMYSDPRTSVKVKTSLKPKLDEIKKMFPQNS